MTGIRMCMLGFMILSLFAVASCGGDKDKADPIIRSVRYETVYASGGSRVRMFSGACQSAVESELSFKVAGTVRKVSVKVGDRVRSGDLIAELDATDFDLQVQEAEASLQNARAQSRNAASNYERIRALYENKNASRNDLDAARAGDESAKANVLSLEKRLEMAKQQKRYTRLTAPLDGAIARVDIELNENVKSGKIIALLTSGSDLEVKIAIPEILISQIREGSAVDVFFDAVPSKTFSGVVSEVSVASFSSQTTFPVTVVLTNQSTDVRAGMAAQVAFKFESSSKSERYIVPSVAVGEDRQGKFVFILIPAEPGFGIIERRSVSVGEMREDGLEVLTGLTDGELLVTAGVSKITHGQKVKMSQPEEKQS